MATKKPKNPKEDLELPTTPPEVEELPTHPPEVEEPSEKKPEKAEKPEKGDDPAPAPPPKPRPPDDGVDDTEKLDKGKLLAFIEDIIDNLTFQRVALIALLVVIGLGLYAIFENRNNLINRLIEPPAQTVPVGLPVWELSERSKAALQSFAKTTEVAFVAVSDVDLQKNRRTVRYYYIDDVANIQLSTTALQAMGLPQAVFDYDAKNTAQMVSVLSNEFRCDAYKDTIYFRYAPELVEKLPLVCRLAIPPFVGQFVGFLTVATNRNLTRTELDTIRLEASRIAVEIYMNDVVKKPAP